MCCISRLTCQLAITELDYQKSSSARPAPPLLRHATPQPPAHHSCRRNLNFGFSVDFKSHPQDGPQQCISDVRHQLVDNSSHAAMLPHITDILPPVEEEVDDDDSAHQVHQVCRQRAASFGGSDQAGYDTFENCLHITNQMDSILTFHYLDEEQPNVIKVKEIFPLDEPASSNVADSEQECRARSRSFGSRQQHKRSDRQSLLDEYSGLLWSDVDMTHRSREGTPKLRCKHKHH